MKKTLSTFSRISLTITLGLLCFPSITFADGGIPDGFNPGADGPVYCTAIQADGKILVGGGFTKLGGQSRTNIGRFNADGTLDTSFSPGADNSVASLVVQTDGKILVGGAFSMLGNQSRSYIGRLNADGLVDTTFNPGANGPVYSLVLQADNKILVAGHFGTLGGQNHTLLGRLNADGTGDAGFNPDINVSTMDNAVYAVAIQADGKILLGGYFILGGQNPSYIGRLNTNGTRDTSFNPGADGTVMSLVVQPDGKILVGGYFTTLGGQSCSSLGRLNVNGTLDTSLNSSPNLFVQSLALQANVKLLVGGSFTTLAWQNYTNIGLLYSNGALDTSFNPAPNSRVCSLAIQADGKILLGGQFTNVGGMSRSFIGRVTPTDTATQSLAINGAVITWLRDGSSPEIGRATFEGSTNGTSWVTLGTGTRISWGWQLTGLTWPTNATFRARGFVTGGLHNGSSWFVETTIGPAVITSQPSSQSTLVGDATEFSVGAGGSGPMSMQWRKNGSDIAGATNAVFSLSNLNTNDAGIYSVVVSNALRTVLSSNAVLTVLVPVTIHTQPDGQAVTAGDTPVFTVVADGTSPLNYQWKLNGTNLSGATDASLVLTNVQTSQAGIYAVVVTNLAGSMTSSNAVLTVNNAGLPVIVVPPTNQAVVIGDTAIFAVVADGTLPLTYQWRFNGTNIAGATDTVLTLTNSQLADSGSYTVLVTNAYGSILSSNAILSAVNPSIPDSFNPGADGYVYCAVPQADGRILVGGDFYTLGGQSRLHIGRLGADGTVDAGFNPGANGRVSVLVVQPDGKILVGGYFSTLGGQNRSCIGRINVDGTLDTNFNPIANGNVRTLAMQADGKILMGGEFTTLGGQNHYFIGRLNADGTPDTNFNYGANGVVYSIVLQADGKILMSQYITVDGHSLYNIVRLNADGSVDSDFNASDYGSGLCLALQADGKILAGGQYVIARLNADGTRDTNFNIGTDGSVYSMAVQADGKILVGGFYSNLGGQSRDGLGRVSADGVVENTFNPGAGISVSALALQPDGKILVGGGFTTLGGQSRSYIGRLTPTDPATQNLTCDGSTVTWQRGGSSPEVGRAVFDGSTNGTSWVTLGAGTRVAGGWQLTGQNWPTNAHLRARGFVSGGFLNGSGWFVETIFNPPIITHQPLDQSVFVGERATFNVAASGGVPFGYQWVFNGTNLFGATNASLTLADVRLSQAGNYAVLVTNALGSALSFNAVLTILDTPPALTSQPSNQLVLADSTVSFSTAAIGSLPMSSQWYFNNAPLADDGHISGATTALLNIANVQTNDAGGYQVVISNALGAITSTVASLTLAVPPAITLQPTNQAVIVSSNVTFTAAADGMPQPGYHWYFSGVALTNGMRITGSDTSALSISNLLTLDAGSYTVTVTNMAGSATSSVAVLTVLVPPSIISQPASRSVPLGLPASFSASADGTAPLGYQWQLNGTDIPGANGTNYIISAATTNDFGVYHLVVGNAIGTNVSANALFTRGEIAAWGYNDSGQTIVPPNMTNVASVSAGGFCLALLTDGTVVAWGNNTSHQTEVPPGATNVVALAAGGSHSLALRSDGSVIAWGANFSGQANVPAGLSNVVAIAAGQNHNLALRSDGKVFAWGANSYGQTNIPASVVKAVAIGAGYNHSLAVRSDGTVVAWGYNNYGQTNVPTGLADVTAVAGGGNHSLALRSNGTVAAWGENYDNEARVPPGLSNVVAVAAGMEYSAALRADGRVLVWGLGNYGQTNVPAGVSNTVAIAAGSAHLLALIGDGRPMITRQPMGGITCVGRDFAFSPAVSGSAPLDCRWQFNGVEIPNATNLTLLLSNLSQTNAGNYQLVASNAQGTVASVPAQITILSNNTLTFSMQPVIAPTIYQGGKIRLESSVIGNGPLHYQWYFGTTNTVYSPLAGATNNALLLDPALVRNTGRYYLTVSNQFDGIISSNANTRILFAKTWGYQAADCPFDLTNVVAVAVNNMDSGSGYGPGNYLVLRSDGRVSTWQPVYPYYMETNIPVLTNWVITAIAGGNGDYLALRSDGTVYAWGRNPYLPGVTNVPAGLSNVVAIACGPYHDLALQADGTVVGWGLSNNGLVTIPMAATNVVAIAAGLLHNLALRADGSVIGWGYNSSGETTIPLFATNVIAVAAGYNYSLALRADGSAIAWGTGSTGSQRVPTGLSNVVAISTSGYHSTALRADGTAVTWGTYYNNGNAAAAPSDLANVVRINSGGDLDIALFGTRTPSITIQPVNRTVLAGTANVLLVGKVVGAQPMAYQWQFNGADVAGATNDVLTLTNLQFAQAGLYQLVASNDYGAITSRLARLVVTLPLGEALDAVNLACTTSWSTPWFGQTNVTHDGVDAAQSGSIEDGQETILQTTVITNGSGRCTFWWKISSEPNVDTLEFRLNGAVQTNISGEVDWQQYSVSVPAGTNVLQWRYSKNAASSSGQDAGWVDQFAFLPDPPVITRQPTNRMVNMGTNVLFVVTATGCSPLTYQWLRNGIIPVGGNNSILTLTGVGRAQNGIYFVTVTNAGGSVTSSNATLNVRVPQQLGAPVLLPDGTWRLTSGDADGGLLSESDLANFEVLASTNLADWVTLTNALSLTNGMLQLQDPGPISVPARFYRIIEH